jgi:hypothetical protein
MVIFDIETIPLNDDALARIEPGFEAPGNFKDPDKIAAAIAEKRAAWREKAALSPLTGRVAMIGLLLPGRKIADIALLDPVALDNPGSANIQELNMLEWFWSAAVQQLQLGEPMVGFNSHRFDVPFLVRRSWALGVTVPGQALQRLAPPAWVDLMLEFTRNAAGEFVGLDTVARFLGVGAKNGNGLEVARLLREDRDAAINYLENDLLLTAAIAERMGVSRFNAPPRAVEPVESY